MNDVFTPMTDNG